jgi:hypothetical protein
VGGGARADVCSLSFSQMFAARLMADHHHFDQSMECRNEVEGGCGAADEGTDFLYAHAMPLLSLCLCLLRFPRLSWFLTVGLFGHWLSLALGSRRFFSSSGLAVPSWICFPSLAASVLGYPVVSASWSPSYGSHTWAISLEAYYTERGCCHKARFRCLFVENLATRASLGAHNSWHMELEAYLFRMS